MGKSNREVADYFNRRGVTYASAWQSLAKRRLSLLETDVIEEAIQELFDRKEYRKIKTLDVGTAIGRITKVILRYNTEHFGIDISETMIGFCKKNFSRASNVKEFRVHDITKELPSSWGAFDFVTAIRVLSYTPDWKKALANIYKAMKQNGFLVFTFPNSASTIAISKLISGKKHLGYESTYEELWRTLKKTGFSEVRIKGLNRLPDIWYDWSNDRVSSLLLFTAENTMNLFLGKTFMMREFYIVCRK